MSNTVVIRTARDRLRYAALFELPLIGMLAPPGALILIRCLSYLALQNKR